MSIVYHITCIHAALNNSDKIRSSKASEVKSAKFVQGQHMLQILGKENLHVHLVWVMARLQFASDGLT